MKKANEVEVEPCTEIYSKHIGLRFKISEHKNLQRWAKALNLPPAVFVRQIVLNELDRLDLEELDASFR